MGSRVFNVRSEFIDIYNSIIVFIKHFECRMVSLVKNLIKINHLDCKLSQTNHLVSIQIWILKISTCVCSADFTCKLFKRDDSVFILIIVGKCFGSFFQQFFLAQHFDDCNLETLLKNVSVFKGIRLMFIDTLKWRNFEVRK